MISNKTIASKVADIVFRPKLSEKDELFAIQLFVENVLNLPDSYSKEDIESKILALLN